jgi:hypothetical protein
VVESPSLEELMAKLAVVPDKRVGAAASGSPAKDPGDSGQRPASADLSGKEEDGDNDGGDDDDVVSMQETVQLRDPVSLTVIQTPIKSRQCVHVQCFDFAIHLHVNRVRPIWKCPHCSGPAKWEDLFIDDFFRNILAECDDSVKKVLVHGDGSWDKIRFGDEDTGGAKARKRVRSSAGGSNDNVHTDDEEAAADPMKRKGPYAPRGDAVIEILSD